MEYEYVVVDVFTKTRFKGNPLAVVLDAQGLSESQMQAMASEFNLSETVFFLPPALSQAAIKARIFTPRRELSFAGHPTIGAAAVLSTRRNLPHSFIIEEGVGPVNLESDDDGSGTTRYWLTTPPVTFYESLDAKLCARLLGLDVGDVRSEIPPTFVSAGSPVLLICLKSADAVDRAQLQPQYLQDTLGSANSVGTFFFARQDPQSATNFNVYARMFAPQTGIAEDPATGGATGPLAAYMMRYGLLPRDRASEFVSEQGTKMNRQSFLHVRVNPDDGSIKVGGSTVTIACGSLHV
jgi:trans-2,3-dihydro-3-hydroxyanthranilate isomerase